MVSKEDTIFFHQGLPTQMILPQKSGSVQVEAKSQISLKELEKGIAKFQKKNSSLLQDSSVDAHLSRLRVFLEHSLA